MIKTTDFCGKKVNKQLLKIFKKITKSGSVEWIEENICVD